MGAVTAANAEFTAVDSQEEFEAFYQKQVDDGIELFSASFENHSTGIQSASLKGNIREDELVSRFERAADLTSFQVKDKNGRAILYDFTSGEFSVHELGFSQKNSTGLPEWQTLYMAGLCVLYGFAVVDDFIERNGLRPVVDEIQRRRWAIMIALMLFSLIK